LHHQIVDIFFKALIYEFKKCEFELFKLTSAFIYCKLLSMDWLDTPYPTIYDGDKSFTPALL
jgi:hypothetical protein